MNEIANIVKMKILEEKEIQFYNLKITRVSLIATIKMN